MRHPLPPRMVLPADHKSLMGLLSLLLHEPLRYSEPYSQLGEILLSNAKGMQPSLSVTETIVMHPCNFPWPHLVGAGEGI